MTSPTAPSLLDWHQTVPGAILIVGSAGPTPGNAVAGLAQCRHPLRRNGVRSAEGNLVPLAVSTYRNRVFSPDPVATLPAPGRHFAGSAIFGGIAGPQFGHLITQSLGRLWAGTQLPQAPILFLPETQNFAALPGYFTALAGLLGVTNPILLIDTSATCDRLLVPKDICNLAYRPPATPEFRRWLTERRPVVEAEPQTSDRIYVSRSALGAENGQYLQEKVLEAALEAVGYQVYHPERHPIDRQIAVYSAARHLIFADGSAAHLWSLFAQRDQKVAIILRRLPDRYFVRWFRALDCPAPDYIDCGIADFRSRSDGPGRSVTLLDLQAVWDRLRGLGFHNDPRRIGPPRVQLEGWVATLSPRFADPGAPPFELDPRSRALIDRRKRVALRPGGPTGAG